ncbi:GNAT family N-acetyltransferase [Paenibacillus hexagrammi]|uniref:GNAT family N-acetyltransferase n=1 Tax=Paenibacillus hexagrammi TaxID=2908839 RepID=A0ABY3SH38_9BACL|nr:GNAT family N-acetyltransferase [Paenibacillus sp. YPD9-1]UJF32410.1 GNAT family N-acetyltransferase [Paenibacillus sp. YPD9-1]
MIRKRLPSVDDRSIHRLVVDQLVPFSKFKRAANASATFTEIKKRLNQGTTFVVAKGLRAPVGFISLLHKSKVLFIDMLAVDPRTQSRGWGKELMRAAEEFGRARGCHHAELFVDDSNPKALQFYMGRGYSTEQYFPDLGCYRMSKPLH